MKLIFPVILIFALLFSDCEKKRHHPTVSNHVDIHQILQTIPEQDRKDLDSFFQLMSRYDCFSYTLFGNKPMFIACYPSEIFSSYLYHPNTILILEKGWKVWQTYASLFPSDEFVLKKCINNVSRPIEIYLVNKKQALKTIMENIDTFRLVLGPDVSPQHLVEELCYSQQGNMDILKENTAIGILLGFGNENSMNFERTTNLIDKINAKMTPPFSADADIKSLTVNSQIMFDLCHDESFSYPSKDCFPSFKSLLLAEDLNNSILYKDSFEIYGSDSLLDKFMPPAFAARKDSAETKKLHDDYLATRQKIHQAYQHGSFLEVTLKQWMYPQ